MSLASAIDHLHALKSLVWDARLLYTSAPATLARSAIENSVTGLWVISSDSRDERISMSLRWYAQDASDQDRAMGQVGPRNSDGKLERLRSIAQAPGIPDGKAVSSFTIS